MGFESLGKDNLTAACKKTPLPEDYARRVGVLHDCGIQVNGRSVLGFECATFHILTPYPGTPMFRQFEREGRLLHRDWSRYDTSHVVFEPARMTVQELEDGYEWCYRQLFSMRSIWRRRPVDRRAVLSYLAMSLLYKKSNWLWPHLIRHRLVARAWRPLVELTRRRHVRFRQRLLRRIGDMRADSVVPAGV